MAEKTIQIDDVITVGDLAQQLDIPATTLIGELMKNGVMATVNERIDFDTAEIVTGEINADITLEKKEREVEATVRETRKLSKNAESRPPVVAVMGHVDHGKTSLLDAIREADVAAGEAGGITQHISAYQITHKDRKVTFLDTPGHEAFAALREHGAALTDVAVIVVAADDGVKPQTKEAIRFAQQAGVKIVVALNKVDKPAADSNRVKQQLSDEKLLIEEWGGDIVVVEVSAKKKTGIDQLLDMILLVSDVEELKADVDGPAEGIIIESHMEKGRGPVARALVEHGILKPGDLISAGGTFAKIRNLENAAGDKIPEAGPSTPVVITGFKSLPRFGDIFHKHENEKAARQSAEDWQKDHDSGAQSTDMSSSDLIAMIDKTREQQAYNIIVKADVQGSLKSVIDSLRTLENKEVNARVVGKGVGAIGENDVRMASGSEAVIYGFNVDVPVNIKQLAIREGVSVKVFKVIYELIDDVKASLSDLLSPEIVEKETGRVIVKGVFRTTKSEVICGGEVTKGKATAGLAKVERDGEVISELEVESVQRQQQEAKEVLKGEMCGLQLKTKSKTIVEEGDRITFFTRETVTRKL